MSLKTYLRTLLESVFTSKKEWIGGQVLPPGAYVSLEDATGGVDNKQYIAPGDGWIAAKASSTNTSHYLSVINLATSVNVTPGFQSGVGGVIMPVKKGQKVYVLSMNINQYTWVRFYRMAASA